MAGCGEPPLVNSVKRGETEVSKRLMAQADNLDAQDRTGATALHAAVKTGNRDLYQQLLAAGASPNVCDHQGSSVVHLAAEQSDVWWLKQALQHGGNPNQPNTGNRHSPDSPPLLYAIQARKPENALALIAAGADVNHKNHYGTRPLKAAMGSGLMELAIHMIDVGADPSLPDNNGKSFIDCCGWFDDGPGIVVKPIDLIPDEKDKESYRRLRQLLVEKGFLKPGTPTL